MDLKDIRQRILNSERSEAEKARAFVNNKIVRQLTIPQWQTLIDDIPDGIVDEIAELFGAPGTAAHTLRFMSMVQSDLLDLFSSHPSCTC